MEPDQVELNRGEACWNCVEEKLRHSLHPFPELLTPVYKFTCCAFTEMYNCKQINDNPQLLNMVSGYLEVKGVVGVRHQAILISALQFEAVGNPAVGRAILAVAVKFGQAVAITELLEVLVGAVHSARTQVLHYTCKVIGKRIRQSPGLPQHTTFTTILGLRIIQRIYLWALSA